MINFDTGSLLSGSQAMWDADTDAQKHWMQTNGVDAFCVVSGVGGLMGLDMKTVPVSSQAWDEVSTAMLNQLVGSPRQEMVSLTLPLPTAYALQNAKEAATPTWLFQTREGAMGVLQITGFTVNPRGVKIRYKLLQNGGTTSIRDDTTLLPAMYSLQDSSNQERVRFTYVIASGDTVARIAHKFGMSITALKALNPDLVPNRIRIGQQITVTEPISAQLQNPMTVTNHVASLGNPPAAPNLSFGPMLERTIYNDKTGKDWLLNLESGETFSLPPGLTWEKNFSTVLEWLHLHGIHLMGFTVFGQNWHDGDPVPATVVLDQHYGMPEASTRGLYGFEMEATIMQSPGLTFESITPLEISNALQKLVVPAKGNNIGPFLPQFAGMAWHDAKWQGTDDYLYAFQTDDGQSGVLQITGFTVNPRGVKIRYKLLQNGNGKN
jgi:murein DD-endopeptidase MepM/ murein hydrolase activator NlpD